MHLDLKESLAYPFGDAAWPTKLLWAVVSLALLLPAPMFLGYCCEAIRGTARGDKGLPSWGEPVALWTEGFTILLGLATAMSVPAVLALGFSVLGLIGSMGSEAGGLLAAGMALIAMLLMVFSGLGLMFLLPAMLLRWAMTRRFASFLNVPTAVLDLKQSVPDYVMISLFPMVASLPLSLVGVLLPGGGTLLALALAVPFTAVAGLVMAHMLGKFFEVYFTP